MSTMFIVSCLLLVLIACVGILVILLEPWTLWVDKEEQEQDVVEEEHIDTHI